MAKLIGYGLIAYSSLLACIIATTAAPLSYLGLVWLAVIAHFLVGLLFVKRL